MVFGSDVSGGIRNVYVQDISIKNITLTRGSKTFIELSGEKSNNVTLDHADLPFVKQKIVTVKGNN